MIIKNISSGTVTLLNGKQIRPNQKVTIKNPDDDLKKHIKALERKGIIEVD